MIKEKPKKYFFIQYIPELVHAVGETEALLVMLLHQTLKWNGKCQVHEGKRWYWHTYQGWASYLGTRSEKSIRVAFTRLRTLGVVETRNFNTKKYDRTLWYSLNYAGLLKVLREVNAAVNNDGPNGSFYQMILAEITGPIHKNINIRFKLKEKETHANAVSSQTPVTSKETAGEKIESTKKRGLMITKKERPTKLSSVSEIMAQFDTQKKAKLESIPETLTPKNFEALWKVEVSELEGVHLVKSFTMIQLGQTKHFIKAMGPDAFKILRTTLRNWIQFTKRVASAAGLKNTPDLPELGFLVKYSEHAYALHAELSKDASTLQVIAPKVSIIRKNKAATALQKHSTPNPSPSQATQPATPPISIDQPIQSVPGASGEASAQDDGLVTLDFLSQFE